MKKLVLGLIALTTAASVFAQGTVLFNNRTTGTIITHVYAPQTATPTVQVTGNGATDFPVGATVYTGAALTGSGWTAELWAASGAGAAESALAAATPTSTFRTGGAAGNWVAATATLTGVAKDLAAATGQIRVFPTTYGTWAAAEAAWNADTTGNIWIGKSPLFAINAVGGDLNPAPSLVNLVSFSLVAKETSIIPEPSSFALLGLGALGMLIFRRK
jgi:hypothetical protein